VRERVK
jgi:hypothetical protein